MGILLDVIFVLFIMISILVIACVILPTIFKIHRTKDLSALLNKFINSTAQDGLGALYVALIKVGFFTSLRTNNHSKPFDDSRHLGDFKKYATPEIRDALKKVGDAHERYFV